MVLPIADVLLRAQKETRHALCVTNDVTFGNELGAEDPRKSRQVRMFRTSGPAGAALAILDVPPALRPNG
jgi:hypothetical protein